MNKKEILDLLSDLAKAACEVLGKLVVKLVEKFPFLVSYLTPFLIGAQDLNKSLCLTE
jgi:hypothetical protein